MLSFEEKQHLRMCGGYIPNRNVCQTIGKVSSPKESTVFFAEAEDELEKIRERCKMPFEQATTLSGHTEGGDFVGHPRSAFDVGVKTLCLALNYFPSVYTISSCSGFHEGAFLAEAEAIVLYVAEDYEVMQAIREIVEQGAVGIKFKVGLPSAMADAVGEIAGIVSLDMPSGGPPGTYSTVRAYGREIRLPEEPFDSLDEALMNEEDPMYRTRNCLVGYFALALELFRPKVAQMDEECQRKFQELVTSTKELRNQLIAHGNEKYGLSDS